MGEERTANHYNDAGAVFISSEWEWEWESALNIPADRLAYRFSKTAQLSIARGIAKQPAGSGVTVNSVLPGPTFYTAYCAIPFPNDQFSFSTSTRLMNTSSRRNPGDSASSSAMRLYSAFFCSSVRVLLSVI